VTDNKAQRANPALRAERDQEMNKLVGILANF
jgi:hypothetical protein